MSFELTTSVPNLVHETRRGKSVLPRRLNRIPRQRPDDIGFDVGSPQATGVSCGVDALLQQPPKRRLERVNVAARTRRTRPIDGRLLQAGKIDRLAGGLDRDGNHALPARSIGVDLQSCCRQRAVGLQWLYHVAWVRIERTDA